MELKQFVAETLAQILAGVREAQATDDGENVNAKMPGGTGGNLAFVGTMGNFTRVDFDVAVSAESAIAGKGGLKVFSVGAEGQGSQKQSNVSRVQFSVGLKLPEKDWEKVDRRPRVTAADSDPLKDYR